MHIATELLVTSIKNKFLLAPFKSVYIVSIYSKYNIFKVSNTNPRIFFIPI